MSFKKIFLPALLAACLARPESAESLKFLYAQYYPANYLDPSGAHSGFFIDIIRELFERRMGITVEIETLPWVRCQKLVEQGQADMIATIPTPERLAYTEIVNPPIWIKKYRIYTYAGNPSEKEVGTIRNLEDLRRKRLTVISYIGHGWAETALKAIGIPVIEAVDVEGMYRMLAAKRGEILAEDPLLARPVISSLGLSRAISLTDGLLDESGFNLLLGKKSPFAARAAALGKELAKMERDGTIEKIMSAYR